jgi:hypothetical protein
VTKDQCPWCGAYLHDYGDVGPLHMKDGRSVNACELIQLRALRNQLVDFAVEPYKNTDDPDVKLLDWNTLGPIIDRACELKQKQASI